MLLLLGVLSADLAERCCPDGQAAPAAYSTRRHSKGRFSQSPLNAYVFTRLLAGHKHSTRQQPTPPSHQQQQYGSGHTRS
jgi:hypothetical protein